MPRSFPWLVVACHAWMSGVLIAGEDERCPDAAPRLLRLLASPPTAPAGTDPGLPAPRGVFLEQGDDNVVAILVQPDVDGDGVSEVVAGWGIDKTGDNLTVSTGAGFLEGQLAWGLETADGLSGGYFPGPEALASYPDITSDGAPEVIACTGGGGRAATLYDGASGAVLQSFNTYLGASSGWVYDVAVVEDVNGNGTVDFAIAVGSDDDAVYMIDGGEAGEHHTEIWRHAGGDAFYGVVAVGDVDDDGVGDVVVANGDNASAVKALSGVDGSVLWSTNQGATNWHMSLAPDANGDGVHEVLVASWQGQGVRALNGRTGALVWSANAGSTLVQRVRAIDDVNGDGQFDVVVAGSSGGASVFSGNGGALIWNRDVGSNVWEADAVPDVTGDGVPEVAFGDFLGFTRLVDGTDGSDLWLHSADGHKVLALRGAGDLDGDGRGEVVIGAQQLASGTEPMLFVVDADSGVATGGPELTPSGAFPLDGSFDLELAGATPGHDAWILGGFTPALIPIAPGTLAVDPFVVLAVVPGLPSATLVVPIATPADPVFDGLIVYMQIFVRDPVTGSGQSSNRVGFLLEG